MDAATYDLESAFGPWRDDINRRLAGYMDDRADCPPKLREAMAYSLLAGGKRLRPLLALVACEACGGDPLNALPAACALEMVHTYSLIHDDLPAMDDDDLRRGRPTNHKVFGEALAILAGDALLTLAFEIIARDTEPPQVAAACCADLAAAAGEIGMVAGQVVDIEAETTGVKDVTHLESIHRRKTGRLITSGLSLGGRIAGAPANVLANLTQYGTRVGLAFQIADDLLDVQGDPEKMGKGVRKDAGLGKLTYPGLLGLEQSQQRLTTLLVEAKACVAPLGPRSEKLLALADFVGRRDH